eukprot:jgi/Botrbrau1/1418/Bobra.0063s0114.1
MCQQDKFSTASSVKISWSLSLAFSILGDLACRVAGNGSIKQKHRVIYKNEMNLKMAF